MNVAADSESGLLPVDLLLGEGTATEQEHLRAAIARDPLLAIEMAETRQLLEGLRALRVAPSIHLPLGLQRQLRRAERQYRARKQAPRLQQLRWLLAAAALAASLLWFCDPLAARRHAVVAQDLVAELLPAQASPAPLVAVPVTAEPPGVAMPPPDPFAQVRQRLQQDGERRLAEALQRLVDRPGPDALTGWLRPSNALAVRRLDFELRASAERRRAALQRRGGNPDVDLRVQTLASELAAVVDQQLPGDGLSVLSVSYSLRALLASGTASSGGPHAFELQACADWLRKWVSTSAPLQPDGDVATALAALTELAASTGVGAGFVTAAGNRLLASLLDQDGWQRSRPELLAMHTPLACLADAGRLLALLPAFGVDAGRAFHARQLLLAHLEERRLLVDPADPRLLAAELYGFDDLVDRDALDRQLGEWRAPQPLSDLVTLHHLAWSRRPAARGWTRFQQSLCGMSALPTPATALDQAALLLCLSTIFAAPVVSGLSNLGD